jgi:hypothetical protein
MRKVSVLTLSVAALASSLALGMPSATATSPAGTLRHALDHAPTCAALRKNFTYIDASKVQRISGRTYITYRPARLVCGGEDDSHYVTRKGVHHVYVNAGAEVVIVHNNASEHPSTAKKLPGVFAAQDGAFPIFAVRHSSFGHLSAIVQRYHP